MTKDRQLDRIHFGSQSVVVGALSPYLDEQLDINTVAAGGGSRLFFQSGLFVVGPESAGANPGPVCYKKDGFLAVTDANLVLGRLLPEHFPKIFGPTEDQPLDSEATAKAFEDLTAKVNAFEESRGSKKLTPQEVALGFIRVANEAMCRPIRALTQAKGHDTSHHVLAVFGGAGGQHACAVARSLGMRRVFIHRYAGILSAYGLALADTVQEAQEPCAKTYEPANFLHIRERLQALEEECRKKLQREGFPASCISVEAYLHLRYKGTDCALMCSPATGTDESPPENRTSTRRSPRKSSSGSGTRKSSRKRKVQEDQDKDEGAGVEGYGCFKKSFIARYKREFGFTLSDRAILVDDIRVRGIAASGIKCKHSIEVSSAPPQPVKVCPVYLEGGILPTPVYHLSDLRAGHSLAGPAIVLDKLSTILVEPVRIMQSSSERTL
ncbi:Hydantoinase/oxoprolinase [Trinorchestia longiramus]|nr:Hydantoinase/oxoprolinase [Trinorchestia longiramus]